ncbi:hypothetical protein [uncultured Thiodictyon sp.]|uniref:hypothetical protein n=1 Tax=uncultured Thiodictyon sp. TaxID=1846217 RepID=UPI0025EC6B7B|nr:hypothetical protein [uncultured Thiodictyon sp.]
MQSGALHSFSGAIDNTLLEALDFGLLSPPHLPTWFAVEVARGLPRLAGHDKA